MAITTFAAIDLGSYEVSMKVFEISKKAGLREVDYIRYRMDLGKDTYSQRHLGGERLQELCKVLEGFREIMEGYRVQDYRVCATSAFRELENPSITLEQIYRRTGMKVEILSSSEQHFLGYKSIAAIETGFKKMIQKGTAIVDVGGGSTQISLFDKDTLVTTQNLRIGSLRIRERLRNLMKETTHYDQLIAEYIRNELIVFERLYLKDRNIKNVILLGDFLQDIIFREKLTDWIITKEEFNERYEQLVYKTADSLALEMDIPSEYASLVVPMMVIYKNIIDLFGAEAIWAPGVSLADGIAYDYGEKHKILKTNHNFENDILVAARNIGKRFSSGKNHIQGTTNLALMIFDGMKKIHGMGARERLLLQIAVLLHDCGKYISMTNVAECSYNIIRYTEIIGLSQQEQKIIANVVRYNREDFADFEEVSRQEGLDKESYLLIAKMVAILRLANAMDRSHYQKVEALRAVIRDDELHVIVDSSKDVSLELGLLKDKLAFFETIFGIRPVIKRKRKR
ncbi:MAG TPA: HD domain-containing protein [Candidatus Blautia intestinigallinarum]|nr:HD domain-containing protein [Candidatus Blautia intestinigallinarum]